MWGRRSKMLPAGLAEDMAGSEPQDQEISAILFDALSVVDLAEALIRQPTILKSLFTCANVQPRVVERELRTAVKPDANQISREMAFGLSGYLKPLLPKESEVPAALRLDPLLLAGQTDFCGCCRCLEP